MKPEQTLEHVWKVFDELERTGSTLEKERILRENPDAVEVLKLAYADVTYGVTLREETHNEHLLSQQSKFTWEKLETLCKRLVERDVKNPELSIRGVLANYGSNGDRKWVPRIINRNLRIGVTDTLVNKVVPNALPKFEVQLAEEWRAPSFRLMYVEPKYDGVRAIAYVTKKGVEFFTRNGKPLYNMEHVASELKAAYTEGEYVLDGEILAADWNATSSITRRQTTHPDAATLTYYVFDYVQKKEWDKRVCSMSLVARKVALKDTLKNLPKGRKQPHVVGLLGTPVATDMSAIDTAAKQYIAQGFEGAIVKDADSAYVWKRSRSWIKRKEVTTHDSVIIGFEEGEGRNKGRLGALVVKHNGGEVRIGSGLNDLDRTSIWARREEFLGKTVEWEEQYQKSGITAKARFPVFLRIRTDK